MDDARKMSGMTRKMSGIARKMSGMDCCTQRARAAEALYKQERTRKNAQQGWRTPTTTAATSGIEQREKRVGQWTKTTEATPSALDLYEPVRGCHLFFSHHEDKAVCGDENERSTPVRRRSITPQY